MKSERFTTAMFAGAVVALGLSCGSALAATLNGDAKKMGEGTARTYVETDAAGNPTAIGILLTEGALNGLPPLKNPTSRCFDLDKNGKVDGARECEGDLETQLDMPAAVVKRGDIPFRWVGINWNAEGHPPAPWSVPHFDFHFYIADHNEIAMIRIGGCTFFINCDDLKLALQPVPAEFVAADHVNVKAAVSQMGNHLIDVRTPELANPPKRGFTHSWIYGANKGRIIFYEPMITLSYLLSHPQGCTAIRQPKAWQRAGYYPTEYCIRYLRDRRAYTISLEGLVKRAAQ